MSLMTSAESCIYRKLHIWRFCRSGNPVQDCTDFHTYKNLRKGKVNWLRRETNFDACFYRYSSSVTLPACVDIVRMPLVASQRFVITDLPWIFRLQDKFARFGSTDHDSCSRCDLFSLFRSGRHRLPDWYLRCHWQIDPANVLHIVLLHTTKKALLCKAFLSQY